MRRFATDNLKVHFIGDRIRAIYVHLPFCVEKCIYCNFVSYARRGGLMEDYCRSLCREIMVRASEADRVADDATIYFGGGTPSLLPLGCLEEVVLALKKTGFWKSPSEATIEANPGTVSTEKLKGFLRLGFNRISLGVQSLDDRELKAIGRIHTAAQALESLRLARACGFRNVNADLIYGLPGQSVVGMKSTLEKLLDERPEHVSIYGLAVEEGTALCGKLAAGELELPDEDSVADMYFLIQDMLKKAGFCRYEISNYAARPEFMSRHNSTYWSYYPYIGFGAGACGFDGETRREATGALDDYIFLSSKITEGNWRTSALYRVEALGKETRLGEFMFMGLRQSRGVSVAEAKKRFGVDVTSVYVKDIERFVANGLLFLDGKEGNIRLTERGMALGNLVFEIFVT